MKDKPVKRKWPSLFRLVLWVLFIQLILINISAFLYAGKLTRFYNKEAIKNQTDPQNIFSKTWRLFNGPKYTKSIIDHAPVYKYETVVLKTKSGITIETWYAGTDSVAKGTVVLFHSLSNSKSSVVPEANEFRFMGYHVMLVDFRAHGNSGGNITTFGWKEAEEVKLVYDYLVQKGEQKIILWGTSLGAVAIIKAVADHLLCSVPGSRLAAVILEMPFGSLHRHMKARAKTLGFPAQPFGVLVTFWSGVRRGFNGFKLNAGRYAEKLNCPVLFQWGNNDHFVLKEEAEGIFNHIGSQQKKMVEYENGIHSSLSQQDITKWRIEVEDFLEQSAGNIK